MAPIAATAAPCRTAPSVHVHLRIGCRRIQVAMGSCGINEPDSRNGTNSASTKGGASTKLAGT